MIIDLHSHTHASDGILRPSELIQTAKGAGVDVLAVTDHDTIDGLDEAMRAARELGLELLPGIEISCFAPAGEIHVLGLGIDPAAPGLVEWLDELMARRRERFFAMIEQLGAAGIALDAEAIITEHGERGSLGRPHIARALVAGGHATSIDDAFRKFLNKGRPAYVERYRLEAADAIAHIHAAGGCAVQAHPGAMGSDADIPALVELGLDGLEAGHPDHSPGKRARYESMAAELGLLVTGGSDYHGDPAGRATKLGQGRTAEAMLARLRERSARYAG